MALHYLKLCVLNDGLFDQNTVKQDTKNDSNTALIKNKKKQTIHTLPSSRLKSHTITIHVLLYAVAYHYFCVSWYFFVLYF